MPFQLMEFPFNPKSKGRPRVSTVHGKPISYTPKKTREFENLVKDRAQRYFDEPLDCPVMLIIRFLIHRPQRICWKTKPMPEAICDRRPDLDNLDKAIVDGLENVAYMDDKQIWRKVSEKVYHNGEDGKPKIIVGVVWGGFNMGLVKKLMREKQAERQFDME